LTRLRDSFTAQVRQARIVPLDIDLRTADNPWLQLAGLFKDDPFAAEVEEAIAVYRRELDSQDERA
jgi:hypothetical protein